MAGTDVDVDPLTLDEVLLTFQNFENKSTRPEDTRNRINRKGIAIISLAILSPYEYVLENLLHPCDLFQYSRKAAEQNALTIEG
jgi:hypothetical protein